MPTLTRCAPSPASPSSETSNAVAIDKVAKVTRGELTRGKVGLNSHAPPDHLKRSGGREGGDRMKINPIKTFVKFSQIVKGFHHLRAVEVAHVCP